MKRVRAKKQRKPRARALKPRPKPQPQVGFWRRFVTPLKVFLVLVLTFGFSSVGRAAEKVRRAIRTRKNNLKASYSAFLASRAWAYFHPVWQTQASEGLPAALDERFLGDPEDRIERGFRPSSALKKRVAFWMDIYARFNSQYRVVHDKDNPEIVYGYIDFSPLYRSMPERMARARAYQIEQRILKELKDRVAEAMEISNPREPKLSPEEKKSLRELLARFGIRKAEDAAKPIRRIRAQTGQKDSFLKGIHRSEKLLPEIEAIFKERGLPVALARLPFVESSFNPAARSKVGASGMWQFMPETAKRFAPKATARELSDPTLQSRSAARMFTILREKFDDWGIAVTAYNSGALRLKNMMERHRVTNVEALIDIPLGKDNLGFAGNNFFCEFLAAVLVEAYKDKIFSESEMHVSRLNLSRRVQSLFEQASLKTPASVPPAKAAVKAERGQASSKRHETRKRPMAKVIQGRFGARKAAAYAKRVPSRRGRTRRA